MFNPGTECSVPHPCWTLPSVQRHQALAANDPDLGWAAQCLSARRLIYHNTPRHVEESRQHENLRFFHLAHEKEFCTGAVMVIFTTALQPRHPSINQTIKAELTELAPFLWDS